MGPPGPLAKTDLSSPGKDDNDDDPDRESDDNDSDNEDSTRKLEDDEPDVFKFTPGSDVYLKRLLRQQFLLACETLAAKPRIFPWAKVCVKPFFFPGYWYAAR